MFLPSAEGVTTSASNPELRDDGRVERAEQPHCRVLVADDDDGVRKVACDVLASAGFEVQPAGDGQAAVDLITADPGRFGAIVLDLTMPRLGGREALEEIRAIRADLPVVLSSGYNEMTVTSDLAAGGPVGFIQKPYRPAELIAKVRALLAAAS